MRDLTIIDFTSLLGSTVRLALQQFPASGEHGPKAIILILMNILFFFRGCNEERRGSLAV
jgi:hypothetical protein